MTNKGGHRLDNKITIEIYKNGELIEDVFECSPVTVLDLHKRLSIIESRGLDRFSHNLEVALYLFPRSIGENRFRAEGMDDKAKFKDMLEEYFVEDPYALEVLVDKVMGFCMPSLIARAEKTKEKLN